MKIGIKKFTPVFDRTVKRYISSERQWREVPVYRKGFCHWCVELNDRRIKLLYFLMRLRRKVAGQLELLSLSEETC